MSDQRPLLLYQVLEEEYEILHDRLHRDEKHELAKVEGCEIPLHSLHQDKEYQRLKSELEVHLKELDKLTNKKRDRETRDRLKDGIDRINGDLVATIYRYIHRCHPNRSALCISGGGIRSATFALGVLQGLARCKLLDKFDYLSTVSGGGYIGSWLTAWSHRHTDKLNGVQSLMGDDPKLALEPEPDAIEHLRDYSNYMSPKLGLVSADTWTLVSTILRNLILNWLVLVPLLAALLMLPRLYSAIIQVFATKRADSFIWGWDWSWGWAPLLIIGFILGVVALFNIGRNRPSSGNLRDDQPGFLKKCLVPLVLSALSLTIGWAWYLSAGKNFIHWGFFLLVGVALNVFGFMWSFKSKKKKRYLAWEFFVLIIVGLLSGFLIWVASSTSFLFYQYQGDYQALHVGRYSTFALPLLMAIFLLTAVVFVGGVSFTTDDEDREWWSRSDAWILIVIVGWVVISSLAIFGPVALLYLFEQSPKLVASVGGASAVITLLLGQSSRTPANKKEAEKAGWQASIMDNLLAVAAPLFLILILVLISLGVTVLVKWITVTFAPDGINFLCKLADALIGRPLPYDRFDHLKAVYFAPIRLVLGLMAALAGVSFLMAWVVNINKFSLHSMYRNRLIRAYLGASNSYRNPNPFTGFDADDNIHLHELQGEELFRKSSFKDLPGFIQRLKEAKDEPSKYLKNQLTSKTQEGVNSYDPQRPQPRLVDFLVKELNQIISGGDDLAAEEAFGIKLGEQARRLAERKSGMDNLTFRNRLALEQAFKDQIRDFRLQKPLHVVNIALNLVGGGRLAWQQRKAQSFTASPLHCGSFAGNLGYRRSRWYGGKEQGISLGTAIAISGAAASPNMGYHSSPVVTFLMTLFNARLGWWLGNPAEAGSKTYRLGGPYFALKPMVAEALGLTDNESKYVYLSDGGHFENLGLYEMVLRRCHFIVVSDASQDEKGSFESLGNAVRKIRIDLGVPIEFSEALSIYSRVPEPKEGKYCALGRIIYSCVDGAGTDGYLIYIKPAFYGREPRDVFEYAQANPAFPHESTADQFFTESQFESYRMLGSHIMSLIMKERCEPGEPGYVPSDLDDLMRMCIKHLYTDSPLPEWLEKWLKKHPEPRPDPGVVAPLVGD